MGIAIIVLIVTVGIVWLLIHEKNANEKVETTSYKIKALLVLNREIRFHQITDHFDVFKHYDNKSNYNRVEPAYIMASEIRSNIDSFSKYVSQIKENRNKKVQYQDRIQEILKTEYDINYEELKISEESYKKREESLFSKKIVSPVVDCVFQVTMSYTSPKGQVNLSKEELFRFDDLFACFESVSRNRLDKSTYSRLTAVERGEVSDSLRYDILNRDNFTCVICGASSRQGARLHIDHIIPVSKGGKSTPDNLRTLCERCNIGKSNKIETAVAYSQYTRSNERLVCEKCGAELVLRSGKYGEFYGCQNYPNCKFTKKI